MIESRDARFRKKTKALTKCSALVFHLINPKNSTESGNPENLVTF